jgi:hypothetical protein
MLNGLANGCPKDVETWWRRDLGIPDTWFGCNEITEALPCAMVYTGILNVVTVHRVKAVSP